MTLAERKNRQCSLQQQPPASSSAHAAVSLSNSFSSSLSSSPTPPKALKYSPYDKAGSGGNNSRSFLVAAFSSILRPGQARFICAHNSQQLRTRLSQLSREQRMGFFLILGLFLSVTASVQIAQHIRGVRRRIKQQRPNALDDIDSGVVGPFDMSDILDSSEECMKQYDSIKKKWETMNLVDRPYMKSPFAYSKACRDMALHPSITNQAQKLIGTDDIMLASMSPLTKKPGWQHRWHSDVESVVDPSCTNKTWTAWVPAWGGSTDSGLRLITHTSNSDVLAQSYLEERGHQQCKVCKEEGNFGELGAELLHLAQKSNARSRFLQIPSHDGQAWFFKGTTFHGSINRSNKTRVAFQFHFMPAKCRFRRHDMSSNIWPRKSDLLDEMPVVVPISGNNSSAVFAIKGAKSNVGEEAFPFNNWMFPDLRKPQKVYAKFDRTNVMLEKVSKADPILKPTISELDTYWTNSPCLNKADAAAGIVDMTKCKSSLLSHRRTQILKHIEYHASKLRQNTAAHSVRTHEDYELVYVVKGKTIVSLTQPGSYDSVLYRKEVSAGGLAFYPAWQSHGLVAVESQATYIAIRWLGKKHEKPAPSHCVKFWEDLDTEVGKHHMIDENNLSPSQNLEISLWTEEAPLAGEKSVEIDATGDNFILVTRGSILYNNKQINSPGTLLIPKSDDSFPRQLEVLGDSRILILLLKSREDDNAYGAAPFGIDDIHFGMPVQADRQKQGVYYSAIVTNVNKDRSIVVQYDNDNKFETLNEQDVYFPPEVDHSFGFTDQKNPPSFATSFEDVQWKIIIVGNAAYEEDFLNWWYHCETAGMCKPLDWSERNVSNVGFADVVLYAHDNAMYEKYKNSSRISVKKAWESSSKFSGLEHTSSERKISYHPLKSEFTSMVGRAPSILLDEMKEGENDDVIFLFADLDVFLLRDPRQQMYSMMLEENLDFAAMKSGTPNTGPYNSGFLLFRCTVPMLDLMSKWKVALEHRITPTTNQRVLNNLIRTDGRLHKAIKHSFLPAKHYLTGKAVIKIPMENITNDSVDFTEVMAFHNNFCNMHGWGNKCDKPTRADKLGLWHPVDSTELLN